MNIKRRHDLDALRAVAMLLGIVLHCALSFIPFGWFIRDEKASPFFGLLIESIHGFRMPLFFLLSGFFTAMLWRKRGLGALLRHRFKRIFLPLVLGVCTITPLMFAVEHFISTKMKTDRAAETATSPEGSVWDAVYAGDLETFEQWSRQDDFDPNAIGPDGNGTMIAAAAFLGHPEIVERLIDLGADVNGRNTDNGTALHGAAFLGRWRSAKLLIDNGADVDAVNREGSTAYEVLQADWGTTNYVAKLFKLEISKDEVFDGRKKVGEWLLASGGEKLGDLVAAQSEEAEQASSAKLIDFLVEFPLLNHLWFLWFLCFFVVAFVAYSKLVSLTGIINWLPSVLVASPLSLIWLIPLTMWPLSFMDPNSFGPDTNIGLLPMPQVILYYAIFFFFGALYWDYEDADGKLFRGWWAALLVGLVVVYPIAIGARESFKSGVDGMVFWFNLLEAVYAWLMTIGCMGLFNRFLSNESKTMRYLSDSSYWLYVAHLPLVLLGQWYIKDWQLPAVLKFGGVCLVITLFLLLIYQYAVRYTPIGTLLNGKRTRAPVLPSSEA